MNDMEITFENVIGQLKKGEAAREAEKLYKKGWIVRPASRKQGRVWRVFVNTSSDREIRGMKFTDTDIITQRYEGSCFEDSDFDALKSEKVRDRLQLLVQLADAVQ